jgi:hypothetical protein
VSDGASGRRDSESDQWNWTAGGRQKRPPERSSWLLILAVFAAVLLFGGGLILFLISDDDGKGNGAAFNPSPSDTPGATVAGASQSPEPSATAPAAPSIVQQFVWSRQQSRWLDRLDDTGGYREGESVPLLVYIEGTQANFRYQVTLRYKCGTGERAAFDYISQPAAEDATSLLTAPGPGRTQADGEIPIPDDPSLDFDDDVNGRFQLWAAAFHASPPGPSPSSECTNTKEFSIWFTAHAPSVSLVLAAHLAAASDWGENAGASSQDEPLFSEVRVDGGEAVRVEVAPEAIAP